ncbi:MAG TPA: hypothetical protein VFN95_00445 [Flavitalea sp.]|nr:hypothetical protein [Flavitalea sp.]
MNFSIPENEKESILKELRTANLRFQKIYPGDNPGRQAVHTLYGGANLFKSDTCIKLGEVALKNLQTYAPNFVVLANVLKLDGYEHLPNLERDIEELSHKLDAMRESDRRKEAGWLAYSVYNKIVHKLKTEPVEDFRIDFEDGFGNRSDDEEDATAIDAAKELATGMQNKTISPFIGIRIKPFTEDLKYR